jgi:sugar lactone lactonase YvrE
VDQTYLYWSDGGNILRVPKAGGTSEKIIPNVAQPDEIVMDGDNFYWLNWAGEGSPPQPIMYAPKKGGEAKQLTPPQSPTTGLCLDDSFVYFMTGDGIKKIAKGGGEITNVYHNPSKQPSLGLMQDADNFYFTQMNAKGHSELMKLNKKSGELVQLTPSISHTQEFALDSANVYFFDYVPGTGSFGPDGLYRISKTGGDRVMLDQGDGGWLKYLAVDGKQIYFTDISKVYALAK